MRFHKNMLLLYAITEEYCNRQRPLIEMVKEALEGGVTILQLREKHLSDEELMTEALEIKELCHSYGVPLIIQPPPNWQERIISASARYSLHLPSKTPCVSQTLSFVKSPQLCRFLPSQSAALRLVTFRRSTAAPFQGSRWYRRFSARRILRRQLKS